MKLTLAELRAGYAEKTFKRKEAELLVNSLEVEGGVVVMVPLGPLGYMLGFKPTGDLTDTSIPANASQIKKMLSYAEFERRGYFL